MIDKNELKVEFEDKINNLKSWRNKMTYNEVLTLLTNIHEWCKDRYEDEYATCEDDDNNYELLWKIENIKDMIVAKERLAEFVNELREDEINGEIK